MPPRRTRVREHRRSNAPHVREHERHLAPDPRERHAKPSPLAPRQRPPLNDPIVIELAEEYNAFILEELQDGIEFDAAVEIAAARLDERIAADFSIREREPLADAAREASTSLPSYEAIRDWPEDE